VIALLHPQPGEQPGYLATAVLELAEGDDGPVHVGPAAGHHDGGLVRRLVGEVCRQAHFGQTSSRMVALAWPPPSHMVCRPYRVPVARMWCTSVVMIRAPLPPSG
jgi:hypothetical protein